jgi:hypothetical protein
MRWAEDVTRGNIRNEYKVLVGKTFQKIPFGRTRCKILNDIKKDVTGLL